MNLATHIAALKKDIEESQRNLERLRAALRALEPMAAASKAPPPKPLKAKPPKKAPKFNKVPKATKATKPKRVNVRKVPEPELLEAVFDAVPVGTPETALRLGEIYGSALYRGLSVKRWKFEDAITLLLDQKRIRKVGNTVSSRYYRDDAAGAESAASPEIVHVTEPGLTNAVAVAVQEASETENQPVAAGESASAPAPEAITAEASP